MLTEKKIELILHNAKRILRYGLQYDKQYWIESGIFELVSSGTSEGMPVVTNEAAAATYIARRCSGTDSTQRGDAGHRPTLQAESLIEQFARDNGFRIDNTDRTLRLMYGSRIAFGSESIVYFDAKRDLVVKAIDTETYGSVLLALYRVIIHNSLFPEASLNVVGFGRSEFGLFEIVAEQPYISGRYSTFEEVSAELLRLGAKEKNGDFVTDRYLISDIKPKNAIINEDGKIFVIDSYLEFLPDVINGLSTEVINNKNNFKDLSKMKKITIENLASEYENYKNLIKNEEVRSAVREAIDDLLEFYGQDADITKAVDAAVEMVNMEIEEYDSHNSKKEESKSEPAKPAEKKETPKKGNKQKEPKFKVGDWVKGKDNPNDEPAQIIAVDFQNGNYFYKFIKDGGWVIENVFKKVSAPKAKKAPKPKPADNATLVKSISDEVSLFKSYARLHGKKATYRNLLSLHTKLGKAIVSGAIDSPRYRDMTAEMHEKVGAALAKMKKNETVNVNIDNVEKYREIGSSEKLFVGVTLIKRYISLANRIGMDSSDREKQRKSLLEAVNKALADKKVEKAYVGLVSQVAEYLEDKSIRPLDVPLDGLSGLSGLSGEICSDIMSGCDEGGACGLGSIVSATELAKINFATVEIPQENREMIGTASRNGSIMLYGMPGGGKTSFSIGFAKRCAEMGQKVLIISKEEGINQTMQEKLRRFDAVHPNIFITDNVPGDAMNDYDVVIFDSVQSLRLEPSDLEKHQKSMNALRIYIFQVTKDGRFRGTNEFEHLVDCVLRAENGTITSSGCKNRFGGNGSVKVF